MELNSKHLSLKSLAEDDRPREKLATQGRHTLSDAELIAIIIRLGNSKETAIQLAQRMLSENQNNINQLAKLSIADLQKYHGVGFVKAVTIAAAFELGRRRNEAEVVKRVRITSSHVAYQLLQAPLSDLPHEEFWVLLLNRANEVDSMASGVIIGHNHPSGQILPSENDKIITKKIKEGLAIFDISLLDHLIIGDQKYFSFADKGML
jgi:DNA repair protein RadC